MPPRPLLYPPRGDRSSRSRSTGRLRACTLAILVACTGGDATDSANPCGDIDGETGEVPNILGSWTGSFAVELFRESCNIGGLDDTSEAWLQGAFVLKGYVPDGVIMELTGDEEVALTGIVSRTGAMAIAGERDASIGLTTVSISGLTYFDVYRDRAVWEGMAYLGIDLDRDGTIDCDARGDWTALKSGN